MRFSRSVRQVTDFVPNVGHELIKECEIEIGGQRIDRQYGHWLNAYNLHELQASNLDINPAAADPPTMYQKMSILLEILK